jgi:hypothetical protein
MGVEVGCNVMEDECHGDRKVVVMGTGSSMSGGDEAGHLGDVKQDVMTNGRCI